MTPALILNFARQDLKDRYAGSMLGGLWSFIMPLINILIFALIFSQIMGARLESFGAEFSQYGYSIYLISGILAWNAFSSTVARVTNVFHEKRNLIGKVSIRLDLLPLYILLTETFIFGVSFVFFTVFLLIIGYPLSSWWLLLPLLYLVQQLFAYSLGFLLAIFSVFIQDIKELTNVVLQLWFWLTPIVYVVNIVPDSIRQLLALNPMVHFISAWRSIIIEHQLPDLLPLAILGAAGLAMLLTGLWLIGKLERDIRDFI
ncbi:MAG: ABC transporter permease [Oceanospirillales bacterium]|uniref:Transport permease protein n=1 Tax=Marinobacterium halophilum TaxID=267374 RepID=A0A2P8EXD0_9GAMM|nr:ABC transporter permease [Marinobacterium halophilum]MBR9829041.1 ABC transporter permease [Oceanospirillales bacterium]PSL14116.1 lipopolysaccharide transport system permease protein [Marinobacterium halophilum]